MNCHPPTSEWNDAIEAAARVCEVDAVPMVIIDAIRGLKR